MGLCLRREAGGRGGRERESIPPEKIPDIAYHIYLT